MGCEFAQNDEWSESGSLDWHLTDFAEHRGVQKSVLALNRIYSNLPAMWEKDTSPDGFSWLVNNDGAGNTIAFTRWAENGDCIVSITNFSPLPHESYHISLPKPGTWSEIFNSDSAEFGGSGVANAQILAPDQGVTVLRVPPLATIWLGLIER